jgi:MFS family permease
LAADRFNQRKLLMLTQASMGVLASALGILTISGYVRLWHVYVFAFVFGAAAALDAPVRQTFVGELVGDEHLPNAVALNSTSYFAGQMIGPAVAGLVIAKIGTGWAFLLNGLSFGAVLLSMYLLRVQELRTNARASRAPGGFIGALLAAGRDKPNFGSLLLGSGLLGIGCTLAAFSPGYWWFAAALAVIGVAARTFTNATNSMMQLSTKPTMRGRVMATRVGVALGGTSIGAPIVGWVANHFGPRWSLGIGAVSAFLAALVAALMMAKPVAAPLGT